MHTVALSNMGKVFTWGCNDEGALGREGAENTPLPVADSLAIPVTDISAGDSHTIAYNSELSHVYIWGLYRVIINLEKITSLECDVGKIPRGSSCAYEDW